MNLSDPRLKSLSPKARDLLERILTEFPHDDLFGSGVPAAPAQLRLTCYRSDDTRLDPDIGRQLKEFELNSIAILRRVSRKTRFLKLTLDFCGAPGEEKEEVRIKKSSSAPIREIRGDVIHNSGRSPPIDLKKIAVVVATATDPLDFCTCARELCPGLDLIQEWNDYFEHRKKIKRPATLETFVSSWLAKAQRRFGKITKRKRTTDCADYTNKNEARAWSEAQPDLFDERDRQKFLEQYAERKERKQNANADSRGILG